MKSKCSNCAHCVIVGICTEIPPREDANVWDEKYCSKISISPERMERVVSCGFFRIGEHYG